MGCQIILDLLICCGILLNISDKSSRCTQIIPDPSRFLVRAKCWNRHDSWSTSVAHDRAFKAAQWKVLWYSSCKKLDLWMKQWLAVWFRCISDTFSEASHIKPLPLLYLSPLRLDCGITLPPISPWEGADNTTGAKSFCPQPTSPTSPV